MGDDGDRPDRERRSWREIDQMRDGTRSSSERRPRNRAEEARAEAASKQYRQQIDGMFSKGKGGAEGEGLAKAVRDALGTPELADACRAYRDAVGSPEDPALFSPFLDCGDSELVLLGLEAIRAALAGNTFQPSGGLKSQLRMLSQASDDAIAEAAEEILEEC